MPELRRLSPRPLPLVLLSLALLAPGCAPRVSVMEAWREPFTAGEPAVRQVLVCRANSSPVNERIWEDALVRELTKAGVQGLPLYTLNPSDGPVDSAALAVAVGSGRVDGVLFVGRAGVRHESRHMRPTVVPAYYPDPFWGAWRGYYGAWVQPGFTDTDLVAAYDVRLFRVTPGGVRRMTWTGRVESRNPGTPAEASQRAAEKIVSTLRKQGVLAPG